MNLGFWREKQYEKVKMSKCCTNNCRIPFPNGVLGLLVGDSHNVFMGTLLVLLGLEANPRHFVHPKRENGHPLEKISEPDNKHISEMKKILNRWKETQFCSSTLGIGLGK